MDTSPIVVEQELAAPRAAVWQAITDPDRMRRWFFAPIADFRAEVGFESRFTVEHGGGAYRHVWRVTEVVPLERITYSWEYEGLEGRGSTTWELADAGAGAHLRLTSTGLHTFPQDDPSFRRESCEGGWRYFLHDRLPAYLAGR